LLKTFLISILVIDIDPIRQKQIMSWGSKVMILEPESLRDEIRAEAEAMLEKYSEDTEKEEKPLRA